jgi:hypothetical protein
VVNQTDGPRWVGLGVSGLTLYGKTGIRGSERTRGTARFSGDGQATQFTIKFADAYPTKPFVVASSNLPIGMGVTAVTKEGCTVTFAAPPPTGKDNLEITWMVQE